MLAALFLAVASPAAAQISDAGLVEAFREMMGSPDYANRPSAWHIRKFRGPVRFSIHNLSSAPRGGEAEAFLTSLPDRIGGLEVEQASSPQRANYRVFIVDRAQYRTVVSEEIYGRAVERAPGRCVVAVRARGGPIQRTTAIIVADEGDYVFSRCLAEEILQGLGPLVDSEGEADSVFSNASKSATATETDLLLLNMLYDPRLKAGMKWRQVEPVLPAIVRDVRARLAQ